MALFSRATPHYLTHLNYALPEAFPFGSRGKEGMIARAVLPASGECENGDGSRSAFSVLIRFIALERHPTVDKR